MRIIDPTALRRFREANPRCEFCGATPAQVHHLFSRGAGQLDVTWNLAALCAACHAATHAGNIPTRGQLAEIVARRENVDVLAIERAVFLLRRLDRFQDERPILEKVRGTRYTPGARVVTGGDGGRRSRLDDVRPGDAGVDRVPPVRQRQAGPDDGLQGEPPGPAPVDRVPGRAAYPGGRVEL